MATPSTTTLRKKRQQLLDQLSAIDGKFIRGSITESYKKCGKPGCKCENGIGHGPKYAMTINFPKRKPEHDYIPLESIEQVREYVASYHQFKDIVEQICVINREILKRREEL